MKVVIDATVLNEKAASLTTSANKIKAIGDEINSELTRLQNNWESDAATAVYDKIKKIVENFENKKEVILGYAKFLESAAHNFTEVEDNTKNAVN